MTLTELWRHRRADRMFALLVTDAKRRGAASGTFDMADPIVAWAEAVVRPVVQVAFGIPRVAPDVLAARRARLAAERAELPAPPAPARASISVSYPLTIVVVSSGALTGLVLDLAGFALGPAHWAAVVLSSIWLSAVLHTLPVAAHHAARVFASIAVRRHAARLAREIAFLQRQEDVERHREALRKDLSERLVAELVQFYEFYRLGARAARVAQAG